MMTIQAEKFTPEVLLSAPRRSPGVPNATGELVLYTVSFAICWLVGWLVGASQGKRGFQLRYAMPWMYRIITCVDELDEVWMGLDRIELTLALLLGLDILLRHPLQDGADPRPQHQRGHVASGLRRLRSQRPNLDQRKRDCLRQEPRQRCLISGGATCSRSK
jgi:hypothetical protein